MRRSRTRSRWYSWLALAYCAMAASGCAYCRLPRIDPTGERIFAEPVCPTPVNNPAAAPAPILGGGYRAEPGQPWADDDVAITLNPRRTVAPIGSEVVLRAGVRGGDGYLSTNRRLEWSIAPGSVGSFVAVGEKSLTDYLVGDFTRPRKLSNTYALGSTSRRYVRLDRGTPNPNDDVCVVRGQGWVSITSAVEGTSSVMAYSPDVVPWDCRVQTALVHWIDAQFGFPPPAINPAGTRHVFTTTVLRQSNQCPHVGWIVRYEIVGGPPAGFAPDGAQSLEVPTNPAGQASAEIFQRQPAQGTNQIRIQVIRAAAAGGPASERLVVGNGSTLKTWTAAALAVRKTGPPTAAIGATVTYCIEVSNPGDLPANEVLAIDDPPEGLTFVSATPAAEQSGKQIQWRLATLGPGKRQVLQVKFRVGQQGSITNCAEVTAAAGLKASDCVTTTIMAPAIDLGVRGPDQINVGGRFTAEVVVTNRGQAPATGLTIKDRFGEGLEAEVARPGAAGENPERVAIPSPIERSLGELAPGQSRRIGVTFRATRAGRLCHTVQVLGPEGVLNSAEHCVTAVDAGAIPSEETRVTPPPGDLGGALPDQRSPLTVSKTGPQQAIVGQNVDFVIRVTNTGNQALANVRIVDRSDPVLLPVKADKGFQMEGNDLVWTVPSMAAGATITLRIQNACQSPSPRACNGVTVTAQGVAAVSAEACVDIRGDGSVPAAKPGTETTPSALSLSVSDLQDPVTAGREVTYLVRVTNETAASLNQVVVTARIPADVVIVPLGTSGPPSTQYDFVVADRTVVFTPLPELRAQESVTYRIRIKTKQPGQVRVYVEATSRNQPQPVSREATTEVLQPQG